MRQNQGKTIITDDQRKLLEWLCGEMENEPGVSRAVYQWNLWAMPSDLPFHEVPSLKRRELIVSEGRGRNRQIWITDKGRAALDG